MSKPGDTAPRRSVRDGAVRHGAPGRLHTYESGKRWIPFYFGNDARRMQAPAAGCPPFRSQDTVLTRPNGDPDDAALEGQDAQQDQ